MNAKRNLMIKHPVKQTKPKTLKFSSWNNVLFFIPHADDEVIGCGGLIHELYLHNIITHVVLVTNNSGAGSLPLGAEITRFKEFEASINILNPKANIYYWGYEDGQLSKLKDQVDLSILKIIKSVNPDTIICPWPEDMHDDHSTIGYSIMQVIEDQSLLINIFFYEVWSPLNANHILDISAHWHIKELALAEHKTALACVDYMRAMKGLASYRSLLTHNAAQNNTFAEAYHYWEKYPKKLIRFADNNDSNQIQQLFFKVFGQEMSGLWWNWKYGHENIKGALCVINDKIVAFYGVLPRKIHYKGSWYTACQQSDVMVLPRFRKSGKKTGVFYETAFYFLSHKVGKDKEFKFAFGFPTERARRLGELLELYQSSENLYVWEKKPSHKNLKFGYNYSLNDIKKLEEINIKKITIKFEKIINKFVFLERNKDYWIKRFADHPKQNHQLLLLKRFTKTIAVAVITEKDNCLEILDVIYTSKNSLTELIQSIENHAYEQNKKLICCYGSSAALDDFPYGIKNYAGRMAIPHPNIGAIDINSEDTNYYILGGDTDFR